MIEILHNEEGRFYLVINIKGVCIAESGWYETKRGLIEALVTNKLRILYTMLPEEEV